MNQINQIEVYRTHSGWAFDDARVGLLAEPFVMGIPEILNRYVKGDIFVATFSKDEFPGAHVRFDLIREEHLGGWYRDEGTQMEGWLCPATLRYFDVLPKQIHIRFN